MFSSSQALMLTGLSSITLHARIVPSIFCWMLQRFFSQSFTITGLRNCISTTEICSLSPSRLRSHGASVMFYSLAQPSQKETVASHTTLPPWDNCYIFYENLLLLLLKGAGSNSASSPDLPHTRACRSGQLPPNPPWHIPKSNRAVISCHCKHCSDQQILLMKAVHGPHTFLSSDTQASWARHMLYWGDLTWILT